MSYDVTILKGHTADCPACNEPPWSRSLRAIIHKTELDHQTLGDLKNRDARNKEKRIAKRKARTANKAARSARRRSR